MWRCPQTAEGDQLLLGLSEVIGTIGFGNMAFW